MLDLPVGARPTLIGCPDCTGVLSLVTDGAHAHSRYVCTVGHAYSLQILIEAKEEQLESGLWSALTTLQHLEMVYGHLVELIDGSGYPLERDPIASRRERLGAHARRLRELIEQDGPAPHVPGRRPGRPLPRAG